MEAKGILGSITFDGQWVTIAKRGFGPAMKGARRLNILQISSITLKPATHLVNGYIQFTLAGTTAANVRQTGRPKPEDPDAVSFRHKDNDRFQQLQQAVESAIATAMRPDVPRIDIADQLQKLADLRDHGVINDHEFQTQKAKLLSL